MSAMTVIHGGHPTNGRRRCKSVGVEEDEGIGTRCTVASCDPSNHLSLSTSGGQLKELRGSGPRCAVAMFDPSNFFQLISFGDQLKELRGSAPGAPSPCLTRPTISTHQLRGSVEGVEGIGTRCAVAMFDPSNYFNSSASGIS